MSYDEDRANLTYQGAMDAMGLKDLNPALFRNTRHIHISSVFMQSALKKDLLPILQLARENHITTSLDTQWDPTEQWDLDYPAILPLVSVFMPNEKELCALTRSETEEEAVEKILPYIQTAVIKQGSRGSLLLSRDGFRYEMQAMLNSQVVDTIGAGDSFNAGFITQYVQGKSLIDCQRYGNMTGAVSTTAAGGTGAFISREAVERVARERFGFEG